MRGIIRIVPLRFRLRLPMMENLRKKALPIWGRPKMCGMALARAGIDQKGEI